VVDAIIRDIDACRPEATATATQLSHADDGAVADNDLEKVHASIDGCTERFARVGLKMKDKKTKAVAVDGAKAPTMRSKETLDWQRGAGNGWTYREKVKALSKVNCQSCVPEAGTVNAPVASSVFKRQGRRMDKKSGAPNQPAEPSDRGANHK
jgi:hypothetical protein